jgi:hypothetical protein
MGESREGHRSRLTRYSANAKTGVAVGITMLIEDFFGAVDRAFISEANRVLASPRLELETLSELPLPAPKRHRVSERCRLPDRRRYVVGRRDALGGEASRYSR